MTHSKDDAENEISGVEIVLEHVSKIYPGQREPAVEDVSLTIPAGEVVVFVGPSGSGKTTTMRMINRLIEPTSGRITIGGRDALSIDANKLRQSIGYAIQQGGLFPHMTVAQNIAVVPKLLKWDKKRIADRVDELLDMVGLDADEFGGRYPRQLSGGQQQRVGVARALAADPPVLLMDEPFGAVDPITRGVLQDQLMQLQAELRKTIVFVTHDFSEAVKLGDKIAVLGARSKVLQYDSPEAILANPANETVEGFVGSGASLQQLNLLRVRDVDIEQRPTAHEGDSAADFAARIGSDWGIILDSRDRPIRWTDGRHLVGASSIRGVGIPLGETVATSSTLQDALEAILAERNASAVVTGARGRYVGVVTIETLIDSIRALREEHEGSPAIVDPHADDPAADLTADASPEGTS
ncbi:MULTISPECIES: ABC transporter ATP-binding protein [Gordonia]|uniref:ABC-type quaternary amine transporter n=1 Tax=Gordonia sihwensis NBRC 108236 TaxID=1223544 RepID=L7LI73_9ACTN|nr:MULTISPECIES: ATP-binding cassette domain-containing protein [Gordonia]AUH68952.1 ABC transporter [Gordonia sp. YC-JH1]GAC59763.1 putative ABC transporter ATP-binding protein [Gordonia sihwensis NBRC 108236]